MSNKPESVSSRTKVTALGHGERFLKNKPMHLEKGTKIIKMIRHYRNGDCIIHFMDGTHAIKGLNEEFEIRGDYR